MDSATAHVKPFPLVPATWSVSRKNEGVLGRMRVCLTKRQRQTLRRKMDSAMAHVEPFPLVPAT